MLMDLLISRHGTRCLWQDWVPTTLSSHCFALPANLTANIWISSAWPRNVRLRLFALGVFLTRSLPGFCESSCAHGVCNPTTGGCVCDAGWKGTTCTEDINECDTGAANCDAVGDCINTAPGYYCSTLPFFLITGQSNYWFSVPQWLHFEL